MYAVMDGERIQEMRQERGLSRQELAAEAGVAPSTVGKVERGERVRVRTGWKVAGVFGHHPKDLGQLVATSKAWRRFFGLDNE
jgi:transcriptional regulator with XRE-family HTH domain